MVLWDYRNKPDTYLVAMMDGKDISKMVVLFFFFIRVDLYSVHHKLPDNNQSLLSGTCGILLKRSVAITDIMHGVYTCNPLYTPTLTLDQLETWTGKNYRISFRLKTSPNL